ncbi:MAG: hypothetical protein J6V44_12785 [Methanobrevibacter sp.]|nr:hypothetical protein [Methanobrevibacter sp.]
MEDYRDLLFTDICARLKYNIKAKYQCFHIHSVQGLTNGGLVILRDETDKLITTDVKSIRLFLFPLSSMTEEQSKELEEIDPEFYSLICKDGNIYVSMDIRGYDWLNKNHFDYRGLIDKGLAIDCTNLNIY